MINRNYLIVKVSRAVIPTKVVELSTRTQNINDLIVYFPYPI
jgi:hypothetical protein